MQNKSREIRPLWLSPSVYFSAAKKNPTDTKGLRLRDSKLLSALQDLQQWSLCASPVRPGRATKWTTSASGRGCSRIRRPSRCPDGSCPEACVSRSPTTATRPPSTRRWLESHTVSSQAFIFATLFPLFFSISGSHVCCFTLSWILQQ